MADGKPLQCECEALREQIKNIREQTALECIDIVLARAMCCGCSDVSAESIRKRFNLTDRP